jgi:septal ring factor EnvC (AmiA/AmiB activator)
VIRQMYVKTCLPAGSVVRAGDDIGWLQSLQRRYPGITDPVHVEIRRNGVLVDPTTLIK